MEQQQGIVSYAMLKSGEWGLRSESELTPGETVTVTKKKGEQKTETVGRLEVTFANGASLYTIAAPTRPDRTPRIEPMNEADVPF